MKNPREPAFGEAYGARRGPSKRVCATVLALLLAAPAAAETRIAALGDSLTHGYGLAEGEGFVPRLEAWLAEHGATEVRVINAGVSGDTTAGGRARIGWVLSEEPDGVIVALGGNDLLRGIDPAVTRENLDAILAEIAGRDLPVLLAGLPAPGNYGPDYKAEFDAIFPDLAAAHDAILVPNFLGGIGERLEDGRGMMQADGIHPNAAGVEVIVEAIGPAVLDLVERARQ